MDFRDKDFFDRLMTEENNRLLKKMNHIAHLSIIWKVFYWAVVIGITIGAYYYVQPFIDPLISAYTNLQKGASTVQGYVNPFSK